MSRNRYQRTGAVIAACFSVGLSACGLPRTADQCNQISGESDRNSCFNEVAMGHVAKDAAIGAVGGAVIGAGVGAATGGPRGVVVGAGIGAGSGAVAGGIYGAVDSYADIEAANTRLHEVILNYRRIDEDSRRRISELEDDVRYQRRSVDDLIDKFTAEISRLQNIINDKTKTIRIMQNANGKYGGNDIDELKRTIDSDRRDIITLEESVNVYRGMLMSKPG